MTIAQLRHEAKERGVKVPRNPKKADLVDALTGADRAEAEDMAGDAVPVEAEVVEEGADELTVSLLPGSIAANFDALEARVGEVLDRYEGWEPDASNPGDVDLCARERKFLNGLARQIDERRKAVKAEYTAPLAEFEARANRVRDRIRETAAKIQQVERTADDRRKAAKRAELEAFYGEYAPLLVPLVPYERIADPKWLNRQPHVERCKEELAAKVDSVARELDTLRSLGLENQEAAELRFFETLDLGQATAWAAKLAADRRKLDEMKREQAAMAEPQPAPAPQPAPQPAPAPHPVPAEAPQPAPAQPTNHAEVDAAKLTDELYALAAELTAFPDVRLHGLTEALRGLCGKGEPQPFVMCMGGATIRQVEVIKAVCRMIGVTGAFKRGTLAEVAARQLGGRSAQ